MQYKKRRAKKEGVKELLKRRMDLIVKVMKKVQCRGQLVRLDETYGNSVERQWGKGQMEKMLGQMDSLMEKISKF